MLAISSARQDSAPAQDSVLRQIHQQPSQPQISPSSQTSSSLKAPPPQTPASPQASPPPQPLLSSREERIGLFLKALGREGVEGLRYLSAVAIGQMVGVTVATSLLGPVGIATGSLYLLTVGTALGNAIGGISGYYWEKKGIGQKILGFLGSHMHWGGKIARTVSTALRVTPRFLYPSIVGATAQENNLILKTLDSLPLKDVTSTPSIAVVNGLERMGAAGATISEVYKNPVFLDRNEFAIPGFGESTLIHELGHSKDLSQGFGRFGSLSSSRPWGAPPYVFDPNIDTPGNVYASTNRFEDFAQSHMFYHQHPDELAATSQEKLHAMEAAERQGVTEKLLDKPAVRDAGKKLAEAIDKVPGLRTSMELAAAIASPLQVHVGSHLLQEGLEKGEKDQTLHGKLSLASGLFLFTRAMAPLALASGLLHLYLSRKIEDGKISLEKANKMATGLLGVAAGPLGLATLGFLTEVKAKFPDGPLPQELQKPISLKGILAMVGGTSLGGIVGAALGTALAGPAGAAIGGLWGKAGGAVAGLAIYGLFQLLGGRKPGPSSAQPGTGTPPSQPSSPQTGTGVPASQPSSPQPGTGSPASQPLPPQPGISSILTKDDAKYLLKIAGGAAAGGTAVAIAARALGGILGAALGGILAGPAGAVTGEFLGKLAGMLTGAYLGSKGGARIGKAIAGTASSAPSAQSPPSLPSTPSAPSGPSSPQPPSQGGGTGGNPPPSAQP